MSVGGEIWACLGGNELWLACRTTALQQGGFGAQGLNSYGCATCCDIIPVGLELDDVTDIINAPWYEATNQDSQHFAGLLITNITGLGPGEITRSVNEAANLGAVLGAERQSAPQVTVTGVLMGDCCGSEFGLQWLRSALKGSCGTTSGCQGDDFTWLVCEPRVGEDATCAADASCDLDPLADYPSIFEPYFRTLKNAACIAGPTVTQRIPRACASCDGCPLIEVQFTIAAGDPCMYREPVDQLVNAPFDLVDSGTDCVTISTDGSCDDDDDTCDTSMPCGTDPLCQDVSPPSMPSIINSCFTDCLTAINSRVCQTIPDGAFPVNGEGTVVVQIFAGSKPMRNIRLKVWNNPLDTDVDDLSDCDTCSTLAISYVAANATLTIDGTNRTSMISCVGGKSVRANPFISTATGNPAFQYPAFDGCGGPYTMCVEVNGIVADDATITITTVGREC